MSGMVIALGVMSALVLAATAVSLFVLRRAWILLQETEGKMPQTRRPESNAEMQELRDAIQTLGAQLHELQNNPAASEPPPGVPRASFNLSRRSQVLRMHRRGESAEQIASSLGMPRQEVDLLLKVHKIVLSHV